MSIQFQPIAVDNYNDAFQIQSQAHSYPWSERVFADCLTANYFTQQLLVEGKVAGFYIGLKVLDEGTLMDIAVAGEYRGQGYGQLLLDQFFQQCQQLAIKETWLEVRQSNLAAIQLYQKNQFQLIETRKGYYPTDTGKEDALIMKRVL